MTNHSTEIMNQATLDFIRQHQDDDVRQLAFLGSKYPEVDMPFALDQIRGRKMARVKLPRWASIDGIIYPPHISMEQCSSEQTALYKAELAARLLGLSPSSSENGEEKEKESENASNLHLSEICEFAGKGAVDSEFAKNEATCKKQQILTELEENVNEIKEEPYEGDFSEETEFVDLTGGFGVDFSYIASRLGVKSMYVERQAHLCEAAKENFGRLGLKNAIVKNGDGIEVLHSFASKKEAAASCSSLFPCPIPIVVFYVLTLPSASPTASPDSPGCRSAADRLPYSCRRRCSPKASCPFLRRRSPCSCTTPIPPD